MLYSSCKEPLVGVAEQDLGIEVKKKVGAYSILYITQWTVDSRETCNFCQEVLTRDTYSSIGYCPQAGILSCFRDLRDATYNHRGRSPR